VSAVQLTDVRSTVTVVLCALQVGSLRVMARKASLAALAANKLSGVTANNTAANAAATSVTKPQAAAVKQRPSLLNTTAAAAAAAPAAAAAVPAVVFHDNASTDSDTDDESSYNESDPLQSKQQQSQQQQQQQQQAPIASTPPASPQHSLRRRESDAWGSPSCGTNSVSGVSITLDCAADAAEEQCLSPRGAEYSMQLRKQVSSTYDVIHVCLSLVLNTAMSYLQQLVRYFEF
jgi:hypothetical protein